MFNEVTVPLAICFFTLYNCEEETEAKAQPQFTEEQATELTQRLYGVSAAGVSSLPSYSDQNFLVIDADGSKFVLKIMNFKDSEKVNLLEVQTHCMSFLRQRGVPTQKTIANTKGQLLSFEEKGNGAPLRLTHMSESE